MPTPIAQAADIKSLGGITSTNQDAVLALIMSGCLSAIANFCNRPFTSRTVTEYRDGNDASGMMLVNYPITSVQSVVIDGVTIPQSVNGGFGYIAPAGGRRITLKGYTFSRGDRNVVITLTAGYGDASGVGGADVNPWPDDLKLAYMMFVLTRLNERTRYGIGSKSMAGESVTYTDAASGASGSAQGIPSAARIILENYMNTIPESGI